MEYQAVLLQQPKRLADGRTPGMEQLGETPFAVETSLTFYAPRKDQFAQLLVNIRKFSVVSHFEPGRDSEFAAPLLRLPYSGNLEKQGRNASCVSLFLKSAKRSRRKWERSR